MGNFLEKVIGDFDSKKEWKELKIRAKTLPKDYRMAYEEIQKYIWKTSGLETIEPFKGLLDMFEEGAADHRNVLEITGRDVASFADQLVYGEKSYFEKMRENLNNDIIKKLSNSEE